MAYQIEFTNQLTKIFVDTEPSMWFNNSFFNDDLVIITQNRQIKNWLLHQATRHFGIAPFLAEQCELSDQAIRKLLPQMEGIGDHFNFTKQFDAKKKQILFLPDLRMVVYKYLEVKIKEGDPTFIPVQEYLRSGNDDPDSKADFIQSTRLFAVASSLSSLLEEYTARYEELMERWSSNQLYTEGSATEAWQQRLWYDLFGKNDAQFALPSDVLRNVLKEQRAYVGDIRKIIIVGTPFLTTLIHQFFMHLAKEIDLHIIVYSAVAPDLLLEGNRFFDKQYVGALLEYYSEVKENQWHYTLNMHQRQPASALAQLQNGITFHDMPKVEEFFHDDSMRLIACAEPMREVESLKDYILHALDSDPTLTLNDICIVMSDQALYTPYLNLVFAEKSVNTAISLYFDDLLADARLPIAYQGILQLLSLATSRFKRSDIFALLENDAITSNLNFTDQEHRIWQEFCEEYHVVWGFDAEHKESEIKGSSQHFSWIEAFDAYLEQAIYDDTDTIYNFQATQTSMMGKLIYFVHRLYENFHDLTHKKFSLEEWISYLEPKLAQFLPGSEARSGRIRLFRSLNEISASLDNLEYFNQHYQDNKLPFIIVLQLMKEAMDRELERTLQKQSRNGILCAPIAALRLIPFRIVAFLGMDEGKYPKKEQRNSSGYNLGELFKQSFIMSQSNNERASFLEMFLGISEHVWFFYQSSSRSDGERLEPSSVLFDLFKEANINITSTDRFVYPFFLQTPLHPFHHTLFQETFPFSYNSRYFHYAQAYYQPITQKKRDRITFTWASNDLAHHTITLDDLVNFIWDPLTYTLEYHLGRIYHVAEDDLDREVYALKKSVYQRLLHDLLHQLLTSPQEEVLLNRLWQNHLDAGSILKTPYLDRHYQDYKRLGQLILQEIRTSHPEPLQMDARYKHYHFTLEDNPMGITGIEATLKEPTYYAADDKTMQIYMINNYIQKEDDIDLGYYWREHIKEKLLNSLWANYGYSEHISLFVGEFRRHKEHEASVSFGFNSINDYAILSQQELQTLLAIYQENLCQPLLINKSMWLELCKNFSKSKKSFIVDYQELLKKSLEKDEYGSNESLLNIINFFQLNEGEVGSREPTDGEKASLEFLWHNFFKK